MTHTNHTSSSVHKELDQMGESRLMDLVRDWEDPLPVPRVDRVKLDSKRTIYVVRDDMMGFGTKARAGSAALFQPEYKKTKTIVYVAPRVGWAPMSLAKLCSDTGRKLILFSPAAAKPSHHQLTAYNLWADLRFVRVAAMPNLQRMARKFAEDHGYTFFPLGLDVPAAVAGIAKTARLVADCEIGDYMKIKEFWTVISTGVLSRGLQLAWPKAKVFAVAVARNIHDGEKGRASIYSHPLPFTQSVKQDEAPPFPSVLSYDAKAWSFIREHASNNAWFWNVAAEPPDTIAVREGSSELKSNVDWGDMSAFDKP
jgi:hypothetical protein